MSFLGYPEVGIGDASKGQRQVLLHICSINDDLCPEIQYTAGVDCRIYWGRDSVVGLFERNATCGEGGGGV